MVLVFTHRRLELHRAPTTVLFQYGKIGKYVHSSSQKQPHLHTQMLANGSCTHNF